MKRANAIICKLYHSQPFRAWDVEPLVKLWGSKPATAPAAGRLFPRNDRSGFRLTSTRANRLSCRERRFLVLWAVVLLRKRKIAREAKGQWILAQKKREMTFFPGGRPKSGLGVRS